MDAEKPPTPPLTMKLGLDMPHEDLQALVLAALVIVFVLGIVFLRSRFALVDVDRARLMKPKNNRRTHAQGRCRWRYRPEQNDGSFRAWRCQRCGETRWTASRSQPPGPCV